ncbi:uncharacterized protein LOC112345192 [Selaginella moellendorffii]|uniref:uncharacterized protein LOC112345192 n=1 Tax=Selaginella moellendorffii TaxID=88036 RepID=UPI000D1CF3F7|nr:uncharacterized protein LOC112345192 [Selaginella moellendorffii]|eukprot:XP_024527266.1 uncharacterized protein LOC112345192 [Selaginella moellendorffii]
MARAQEGESGLDAVVRDAANQNEENAGGQESEFDTIARYRGQAQENMGNFLAQHVARHGEPGKNKGIAGKSEEQLQAKDGSSISDQLGKSSDEARERVFQSGDRTYDAIEEAKKSVQKRFEDARKNASDKKDAPDEGADSYTAINEAKEELKDKYDAARDHFDENASDVDKSREGQDGSKEASGISSVTRSIKEAIAGK